MAKTNLDEHIQWCKDLVKRVENKCLGDNEYDRYLSGLLHDGLDQHIQNLKNEES